MSCIFPFVHFLLAEELLNVITFIVIIKKYLPLGNNDLCRRKILEPLVEVITHFIYHTVHKAVLLLCKFDR